jgi:hypothetical protein
LALADGRSLPLCAYQEDFCCNTYDPPVTIQQRELVCKGNYVETVGRLPKWYRLTSKERTIIQMKEVVGRDVSSLPIAEGNMLPLILPTAVHREATSKGVMHLLNEVHLELQLKLVYLGLLKHADPEYA